MGPVEKIIREKLSSILMPPYLELQNESPQHGLPASAEKHFRLVVVSENFDGLGRIDRHRRVNEILATELQTLVHALSIQAFTPAEWQARGGQTHASPDCLGGGKRDPSAKR